MNRGQGELLERAAALEIVGRALESETGRRFVFVVGEAGMGKSAILDRLLTARSEIAVGRARGEAVQSILPFGLISQALSQVGGDEIFLSDAGLPLQERVGSVWHRMRRWLGANCGRRIVLALDDIHFADQDSLALLEILCRNSTEASLAVVATMRSWPRSAVDLVADLTAEGLCRRVSLEPLSDAASIDLLSELAGRPPGPHLTDALPKLCAGNPLLLRHLATIMDESGEIPDRTHLATPTTLLIRRFSGVDSASLTFARAASVFGVEFRSSPAAALAGMDEIEAQACLNALCGAGLVRAADAGRAVFTHALLRQALYDDLNVPVRLYMHRMAFRLLWESGLPAAETAPHALAGEMIGDETALGALERAAHEALVAGAVEAAAIWLEGAVRLCGPRIRHELVLDLADALVAAGRPDKAAEICRNQLVGSKAGVQATAELHRMAGRALSSLGDARRAEAEFELAATVSGSQLNGLATESLLEASLVSLYMSGPTRSLDFARRAQQLLVPASDPQLSAWVSAAHGLARLTSGDSGGVAEVDASVVSLPIGAAVRGLRGTAEWGPRLAHLQAHKFLEMFDDSLTDYRIATEWASPPMAPVARSVYDVAHADTLFRLGRLAESEQILLRALDAAAGAPARIAWVWVGLANSYLEVGEQIEANRYCRLIEGFLADDDQSLPFLRLWLSRVQSALLLDVGDASSASRLMKQMHSLSERSGATGPGIALWHGRALSAHLAAGEYGEADRLLSSLEASADTLSTRWPRAVAYRGRALLAATAGDGDLASSLFSAALQWHEGLAMPLEEVETLIDYGGFLRRYRSPAAGREVLGRAAELADRCGAKRLEARATSELRSAGGRRRSRGSPDGLTPIDERVARLAASGLTNVEIGRQLFISARTVEHHLSHVFACLEVTSRRQLRNRIAGIHWPNDAAGDRPHADGLEAHES